MRARLWITMGILAVLLTTTLAEDAMAQGTTARGYCGWPGDSDWWTVRVTPGYYYTIWVRPDSPWMNCELYVFDCRNNLICVGTSCTFYAYCSTYKVKVVCDSPGWYTIGIF